MAQKITIFKTSHNCWMLPEANRIGLLIDGANYYGALRKTLLKAKKSVFIVGWDIDSRIRLIGNTAPEDGAPEHLREFLEFLVDRNPELRIHVLLWDFSVLYSLEREPVPTLNLAWSTPPQIEVCLDDVVPLGSSHHQKMVIVDGNVAFCGGLDLTNNRWDTREHDAENSIRVDPADVAYGPFHDMQCIVDGDAATAFAELIHKRWKRAACREPFQPETENDPWPDGVEPIFENHQIAIARTIPPLGDRQGVHEIQQLHIDMINVAKTTIYLENQYFASDVIAKALVARLKEHPALEAIMITSKEPHGFLEAHSMASGRQRFMKHFEDQELLDRVRLLYPRVPNGSDEGQEVQIHAKLTIIDDQFFRVGSANINNRSMGTDSECDIALEASSDVDRKQIVAVRNDLLAEHLGLTSDQVAAGIEQFGNIRSFVDSRKNETRTLLEIDYGNEANEHVSNIVQALADPEKPGDISQFAGDMLSARPGGFEIRGRYIAIGTAIVFLTIYLLWM